MAPLLSSAAGADVASWPLSRRAVFVLGFLVVYLAATHLGLILRIDFGGLTPLWPATGLALVLLLKRGLAWWPLILAGEILTAWSLGQPLTMGLAGGAAEASSAIVAVVLLRRGGIALRFRSVADTVYFCVAVCLATPLVAATIGTTAQIAHGLILAAEWRTGWFTWWLGDAMGLLIVAPLLMSWWPLPFRERKEILECLVISLLLVATGVVLIVYTGRGEQLFFLLLPFVGWLALRFETAGASAAAAVLAALVFGFSDQADDFATAVYVAFVGASACMGYLLSAVVTRQRVLLNELRRRADYDDLTGLYSRSRLELDLRRLSRADGPVPEHALIYLDLDHFNMVNNTRGHRAGDRLLRELAAHLASSLPDNATFARMGGDEFGVLLRDTDVAGAEEVGEMLRHALLEYRFVDDDYEFFLGASIGIAHFTAGEPPAAVLSRADAACHAAKEEGRDRVHVYDVGDVSMKRHQSELEWVSQFRRAMDGGELVLFAQRIVPLRDNDGKPFYEILLRKLEAGEPVSPGKFLPVAARYGLMPAIDRWVMTTCFRFISEHAGKDFILSINLAAASLDRPHFLERVRELGDEHGIDPGRVCFEVTEQIAIRNMPGAVDTIRRLGESGFRFALDDFGSGVASFGYLRQLPLQYVKIDGQFVRGLHEEPENRVVVSSVRELTALRGIHCIAEWVESEVIMDELRRIGVDYAQGYHIHEPEPLEKVMS